MTLIAVAPNGARKTKNQLPNIPLTSEEIAIDASACQKAGAGMIHLHVRDALGRHSLNTDRYKEAIKQIRERTKDKIFIQVTSEAVYKYTAEEQFEMIHALKPDAVSIAIREIRNFNEIEIHESFSFMRENNTFPQIILYNDHDASTYKRWLDDGILPGNAYPVLYVIGKSQAEGVFNVDSLSALRKLPSSSWMVCGFGEQEYQVALKAVELGGHARIGFENNHVLEDGSFACSNANLIAQMASYLKRNNKEIATHLEARKIMTPDW